jgi:hypothetical protein
MANQIDLLQAEWVAAAKEAQEATAAAAEAQIREKAAVERFQLALTIDETRRKLASLEEQFRKLSPQPSVVPVRLALPRLLPDHSDVDPMSKEYLQPQVDQLIAAFEALTSPAQPYVESIKIKEYLRENYEIVPADYWLARTSPKEPERWWKHIYDKCIERMDLKLNLVIRKEISGKKGLYGLRKYVEGNQPATVIPKTQLLWDQYGPSDAIYHREEDGRYLDDQGREAPPWLVNPDGRYLDDQGK